MIIIFKTCILSILQVLMVRSIINISNFYKDRISFASVWKLNFVNSLKSFEFYVLICVRLAFRSSSFNFWKPYLNRALKGLIWNTFSRCFRTKASFLKRPSCQRCLFTRKRLFTYWNHSFVKTIGNNHTTKIVFECRTVYRVHKLNNLGPIASSLKRKIYWRKRL